jgi:hypothetical protein
MQSDNVSCCQLWLLCCDLKNAGYDRADNSLCRSSCAVAQALPCSPTKYIAQPATCGSCHRDQAVPCRYRSRAAFKLLQLNKKHGFLNDARAVLDLCAAPGGWLQVCCKHMPISARILGVDLESIKPVRGAKTIVDDITTQRCRERLRKESEGSLFDVVLHDGAPNVGGAFASEMYTQVAIIPELIAFFWCCVTC